MKYAIIAAGQGARLRQEGLSVSKPMALLRGECLLDRLLSMFRRNGAEDVVVICNEQSDDVFSHLQSVKSNGLQGKPLPLQIVRKTTKSSMHSLHEISPLLAGSCFCLATVDTVFPYGVFERYAAAFQRLYESHKVDALMGVTRYIDDEKPLYVAVRGGGEDMLVDAFLDESQDCRFISAGVYCLSPRCLDVLDGCIRRGESKMRNFQRALLSQGLTVGAFDMGKVVDVDHVEDIRKAEELLANACQCRVGDCNK